MRLISRYTWHLLIGAALLSGAGCGGKKKKDYVSQDPSALIPADWDLKSDYPGSSLKAKDLLP